MNLISMMSHSGERRRAGGVARRRPGRFGLRRALMTVGVLAVVANDNVGRTAGTAAVVAVRTTPGLGRVLDLRRPPTVRVRR